MTDRSAFMRALHVPEEIQQVFLEAALGREFTGILVGRRSDPLGHLLNEARDAALEVLPRFLDADLFTDLGMQQARKDQALLARYLTLVGFVLSAIEKGDHAQKIVEAAGDPILTGDLIQVYEHDDATAGPADSFRSDNP